MDTKQILGVLNDLVSCLSCIDGEHLGKDESKAAGKAAIAALEADIAKPVEPFAYEFQKLVSDSFGEGWERHIEKAVPAYCQTQNVIPLYTTPQEPVAAGLLEALALLDDAYSESTELPAAGMSNKELSRRWGIARAAMRAAVAPAAPGGAA